MQYDNIYQYKIFYFDKASKRAINIYSDSADIHSLQNLPDTTFYVEQFYLASRDGERPYKGSYLVGKPLGIEEIEKEIELIEHSDDLSYLKYLERILELKSHNEASYTIFRIQGKLIYLYKNEYEGELAGEIKDGKIVKEDLQAEEQPPEHNYNYIDLE